MKAFVCVFIFVICGSSFAWVPCLSIAQEISSVGMILKVDPPVFFVQKTGDPEVHLDDSQDIGRILYSGQMLRCGHGGALRLQLNGVIKDLIESDGYFMIPTNLKKEQDTILSEKQRIIKEALWDYGRVAGTRGLSKSSSIFIYPVHGCAVRPSQFVIQWLLPAVTGTVSIKIQKESSIELWRQGKIDVSEGRLDSNEAKKKMIDYQATGEQQGMILSVTDREGNEIRTNFSLLSIQAEKELKRELSLWEEESSPLLRYIGCAYTFNHYHMFYESAQEYDAALGIAPKSYDLLKAAINAHHRIGNFVHEEELKKQLATINE
jgi:hypothetical protein